MVIGKIRIKTLRQALAIIYGSIDQNRILTAAEITQTIHCRRANAYNYRRFLTKLFPEGRFDYDRPAGDEQECLM
jgi:hypothetical protein